MYNTRWENSRDTGGLREDIASVIRNTPHGDPDRIAEHIIRLVSQGAAHEERGLDVERLKRAMSDHEDASGHNAATDDGGCDFGCARDIAAEYARLATPEAGLVRCPLCGDPERVEDIVGGVCLTCADGIAFSQNARRGAIEVPNV